MIIDCATVQRLGVVRDSFASFNLINISRNSDAVQVENVK